MENFQMFFGDKGMISNLLAFLLIILGMLLLPKIMFNRKEQDFIDSSYKIIGVLFVLGITFIAEKHYIYALSIFIVATIITRLDFLENLAAIFWKNDKYWDYRLAISRATEQEIKQKVKQDIGDSVIIDGDSSKKSLSKKVDSIINIEKKIIQKLGSKDGFFPSHHIIPNVSFSLGRSKIILDAIAEGPGTDYIIEIKALASTNVLDKAIMQVRKYIQSYKILKYGKENSHVNVRGLIILPEDSSIEDFVDNDIAIVKVNLEDLVFINRELIYQWIYGE